MILTRTLNSLLLELSQDAQPLIHFWEGDGIGVSLSYRTLYEESLKLAQWLRKRGLQRGQRVALVLPTHPDFLKAFFGVLLAGGVPSALYPPLRLGKMEEWKRSTGRMLQILEAQMVLTNKQIFPFLGNPVKTSLPPLGCHTLPLEETEPQTQVPPLSPEIQENDFAFVQFSSGSTGDPRPVVISHQNVLHNARIIVDQFDILDRRENRRTVSWLPLYHDMGLVGALICSMVAKTPLLLLRPEQFLSRPIIWFRAISEFKAGVSLAPNFAFGLCAKKITLQELQGIDLSCWKVALCGAETIHPKTFSQFIERFSSIKMDPRILTPVYGLAEATLAVTFSEMGGLPQFVEFSRESLSQDHFAREEKGGLPLAGLGRPLPGSEVEIRSPQNEALPEGHVGRIWIKGPSVMQGYLNRPEETRKAIQEGWLDTGDRGFLYRQNLFLHGRFKEIIIHRGKNYDPSLIERCLLGLEGPREGSVVAIGDFDEETGTEKIVILAEEKIKGSGQAKGRQEAWVKQIKNAVQTQMHLTVDHVEILPPGTLPKTSSGKLRRQEAYDQWKKGILKAPRKVTPFLLLGEALKGLFHHQMTFFKRKS